MEKVTRNVDKFCSKKATSFGDRLKIYLSTSFNNPFAILPFLLAVG